MIDQYKKQLEGMVQTIGRTFLSIQYPEDIESYFVSLELCTGDSDRNLGFFTFPINPNAISKKEPSAHNIKKTFGGVIVNSTSDFIPQEITLRGNFGRSLKILTDNSMYSFFAIKGGSIDDNLEEITDKNTLPVVNVVKNLNQFIKTGYGCTKYLQKLCRYSRNGHNGGVPHKLFFHNHILGESYLVKVKQLQIDQTLENNMMYNYILILDIIAPTNYVVSSSGDFQTGLVTSALNSGINDTAKTVIKNIRKSLQM